MERAVKAVRVVAVALILSGTIVAIRQYCIVPYQCNVTAKRVQVLTERLSGKSDLDVRIDARENLDLLQPCQKCFAANVAYLMIKAANEGAIQRYAAAEATYRQALNVDRRPELYLNLGLTQLNLGHTAEGTQSLLTACRFSFAMIVDIPEPQKTEMYRVIFQEQAEYAKRIQETR
jgi:hypothetical protein